MCVDSDLDSFTKAVRRQFDQILPSGVLIVQNGLLISLDQLILSIDRCVKVCTPIVLCVVRFVSSMTCKFLRADNSQMRKKSKIFL